MSKRNRARDSKKAEIAIAVQEERQRMIKKQKKLERKKASADVKMEEAGRRSKRRKVKITKHHIRMKQYLQRKRGMSVSG